MDTNPSFVSDHQQKEYWSEQEEREEGGNTSAEISLAFYCTAWSQCPHWLADMGNRDGKRIQKSTGTTLSLEN